MILSKKNIYFSFKKKFPKNLEVLDCGCYRGEFIDKLYLDTFKSLKKTKNKNTLVSQSDIDKKIGYFKQNVYTFIHKLQDYLKNLVLQFSEKNTEVLSIKDSDTIFKKDSV